MGNKEKLFNKAKNSPQNFKFNDLLTLARSVGFVKRTQKGSHQIFKNANFQKTLNFQPDKHDSSKAKSYQVRELIRFIEENNLL